MNTVMNTLFAVVAALLLVQTHSYSFSSFTGISMSTSAPTTKSSLTMEYIPSGMSKAQWDKIKSKDKSKVEGKDLGKTGITSFTSRSFSEWQKGGAKHLFPVDPKKAKSAKDIPYMQRTGGKADDSDLKEPKKKGWFSK